MHWVFILDSQYRDRRYKTWSWLTFYPPSFFSISLFFFNFYCCTAWERNKKFLFCMYVHSSVNKFCSQNSKLLFPLEHFIIFLLLLFFSSFVLKLATTAVEVRRNFSYIHYFIIDSQKNYILRNPFIELCVCMCIQFLCAFLCASFVPSSL